MKVDNVSGGENLINCYYISGLLESVARKRLVEIIID
jgi:hypothetical protein